MTIRAATTPPSPPFARPDFRYESLFGAPPPRSRFEIDAFSVGLDDLPVDCEGVVRFDSMDSWGFLEFTVESSTGAATATGVIAESHAGPSGAGDDVFSYTYRMGRSDLIDAFKGQTHRVADGAELGLSAGPSADQIGALDSNTVLFELDDHILEEFVGPTATRAPRVYFSVTDATKHLVPASWWNDPTNPTRPGIGVPSGATILVREWDQNSATWNLRPPAYTYAELGLSGPSADMDALAFDEERDEVVFSLTIASTPSGLSQILVASRGCPDGPSSTRTTENLMEEAEDPMMPGSTIEICVFDETEAGSGGEVTGTCGKDPGPTQAVGTFLGYGAYLFSTPVFDPGVLGLPRDLDASGFRSCLPDPMSPGDFVPSLALFMTSARTEPGVASVSVFFGPPTTFGLGSLLGAASIAIPVPLRDGTPVFTEIPLSPMAPLGAIEIQSIWTTIQPSGLQLSPVIRNFL